MPLKRKKRKATGQRPKQHHGGTSIRGLTFDLCCGDVTVGHGLGENRGMFRVEMNAHGFALTIMMDEERAAELGDLLQGCVDDARKSVN